MPTSHPQVARLLEALTTAYQQLANAQQTAILDLGYSVQDRVQLSVELAHSFYEQGFPPYPAEVVQALFRQGDLQALLYILLCDGSILQTGQTRLFQRPGFTRTLARLFPDTRPSDEERTSDASLSPVPEDHRVAPTTRRLRSRRDIGRVGERDTRRLPKS